MTLGIIVALASEARPLSKQSLPRDAVIRLTEHVLLYISGMGTQRAQRAGRQLIEQQAQALLSWGTAVALKPGLKPGQLLIPANVMASDQTPVSVTPDWHSQLVSYLSATFKICTEPLIATDRLLHTATDKQAVRVSSGAVAADMESAALGSLARENRVKFAALRVVTDSAGMRLPDWLPACIDAYGQPHPARLLTRLLSHPQDWYAMLRLAGGFSTAQATFNALLHQLPLETLVPNTQ